MKGRLLLVLGIAGILAGPSLSHAQTGAETGKAAQPGSGGKVEELPGSTGQGTSMPREPVETGKAAQPGTGSKVEQLPGSSGSSTQPPTTPGAADTGSRDVTPGSGNAPSTKQHPTEKALEATPGAEGQGPSAGPAMPPKQ
jgi:hypothetical protein